MTDDGSTRLARPLHPMAWWAWGLGLAVAASRTTNPLLLAVLIAVLAYVVTARRGDAPWARGFRAYLVLGAVVVLIRVVLNALLGAGVDGHLLLRLPEVQLPQWAQGISLGGPVTAEEVLAAVYDGLRLATLLCCVGAVNALANPRRALRSLPPALYEIGVAVVIALTVAPQLVDSAVRVRRARRLRGASGGRLRGLRSLAVPVLEDALARSLALAAAMDSRGYGRTGDVPRRVRRTTGALVLAGLAGTCVGAYGLLDATAPRPLGYGAAAAGVALCAAGLALGGRRVQRTTYRPDPWRAPERLVAASGIACAVVVLVASSLDPLLLHPSLYPLRWPELPVLPAAAVLMGLVPALAAPPPVRTAPTAAPRRERLAA